jgi:hypothetical protein
VLDTDSAGQEGTARLLEKLGARVIPVALPPGVNDPAELASLPHGAELFCAAIREAVGALASDRLPSITPASEQRASTDSVA